MTVVETTSELETMAEAKRLGQSLARGDVVTLTGELGAGKTRFVRGVCSAFGVDTVSSPTFAILNRYLGRDRGGAELVIHHLDLYRIGSVAELYDIGYEEILRSDGVCLVEWAERMDGLLPASRTDVRLEYGPRETDRIISIAKRGPASGAAPEVLA